MRPRVRTGQRQSVMGFGMPCNKVGRNGGEGRGMPLRPISGPIARVGRQIDRAPARGVAVCSNVPRLNGSRGLNGCNGHPGAYCHRGHAG
jgi:hypothetical protein